MTAPSPWHLYLLECRNGSWYAGITNDLHARFQAHAAGRGAKYTRGNPPLRILASRSYPDRASASRAEYQLKRQPRARKLAWLLAPVPGSEIGREIAVTETVAWAVGNEEAAPRGGMQP